MPEWLSYLGSALVSLGKLVLKSRSLVVLAKDLGVMGNKFRNGFLKDYDSDYYLEVDNAGKKKTKTEIFLEGNPRLNGFLRTISVGIRRIIDFATSPLCYRLLFYISAAVGIVLAASNPVGLALAIAATVVSAGSVLYGMIVDVNKFRKIRKMKEEQGMLEELLLLRTKSKSITEKLLAKDQAKLSKLNMYLGLNSKTSPKDLKWEAINKKKLLGLDFLESIPGASIPIISSLVLGNIPGFCLALSGYILERCGSSAKAVAFSKELERLMNANISVGNSLGIDKVGYGLKNEELKEMLAEARARQKALIAVSKMGIEDLNGIAYAFRKENEKQLKNREALTTELTHRSWLQDAKKIWYEDGYSFARTFGNFLPIRNEFRANFKSDNKPTKLEVKAEQREEINLSAAKVKDGKIFFDKEVASKAKVLRGGKINPEFDRLCKVLIVGGSKRKIVEAQKAFTESLLSDGRTHEDLSSLEKQQLKLANMVKFAALNAPNGKTRSQNMDGG